MLQCAIVTDVTFSPVFPHLNTAKREPDHSLVTCHLHTYECLRTVYLLELRTEYTPAGHCVTVLQYGQGFL